MLLCDYLQICCDRKVVPSLTWLNKSRRSLRRPWARHLLSASCSRDSVTDRSIHRWTRRLQEARTTPSVLPCLKNAVNVSCWLVTRALSTQRIYSPSHTCGALLLTLPPTLKHPVSAAASGGGCVGHLPGVDEPSVFTPPNSEKFTACQREKQQLTSWTEFQRSCCYRLIFKLASRCWCLLHF